MNKTTIKAPVRYIRNLARELYYSREVKKRLEKNLSTEIGEFDFELLKSRVLRFIQSMQTDETGIHYKYSTNCTEPTLYASVYACMTLSMIGALDDYSDDEKKKWVDYFDSFQDSETGLFYDPVVLNDIYHDSDWWGARHLALHIIIAYANLGAKPKYPFRFLKSYNDVTFITSWLESFLWNDKSLGLSDVDNKIMNIGCLLQYQRDYWSDDQASAAVDFLKRYLRKRINSDTQIWGPANLGKPEFRSRMVQFAYHLFPIYFYDREFDFEPDKIVSIVLKTQNAYGGFGVRCNSSACEDIDSIELLIRLRSNVSDDLVIQIDQALKKAFNWVLANQMDDGGFVFRMSEAFKYGHEQMSSKSNQGAMFPTWFRCLCLKLLLSDHDATQNTIEHLPGYVVKIR